MSNQEKSAISFLKQEAKEGILSYKFEKTECKGRVAFKCTIRLSGENEVFNGIGVADNTSSAMENAAWEALYKLIESTILLVLRIGNPGETLN